MTDLGEDPLAAALELIEGARARDVPLRLLGGLAVRFLTPGFPPRVREGQDLDLASISLARPSLTKYLGALGFEADAHFNALYGHKQLYFGTPDGRAVDVLIDRIEMCHELAFADRIERMPTTLDVADLLLSKLQIVELTEKDVQDVVYLLAAFPVREGDEPATIGLDRIGEIVADDWGWWRTVVGSLEHVVHLIADSHRHLIPHGASFDPAEQVERLRRHVDEVPKGRRWRLRARIGERVRWYRMPEARLD
jgi:hypothetical protein